MSDWRKNKLSVWVNEKVEMIASRVTANLTWKIMAHDTEITEADIQAETEKVIEEWLKEPK